jgi:hypothetical protein
MPDSSSGQSDKLYQFQSLSALQLVANVAVQLLVLDLCMSFGFTTIVIAALMDAEDVEGSDELKINGYEASWLGNGCQEVEINTHEVSRYGNNVTDWRGKTEC